jgi:hypothetical protein
MDLKASPSTDTRQKIYQDSHTAQFSEQETANAVSAGRILDIVMERLLG